MTPAIAKRSAGRPETLLKTTGRAAPNIKAINPLPTRQISSRNCTGSLCTWQGRRFFSTARSGRCDDARYRKPSLPRQTMANPSISQGLPSHMRRDAPALSGSVAMSGASLTSFDEPLLAVNRQRQRHCGGNGRDTAAPRFNAGLPDESCATSCELHINDHHHGHLSTKDRSPPG